MFQKRSLWREEHRDNIDMAAFFALAEQITGLAVASRPCQCPGARTKQAYLTGLSTCQNSKFADPVAHASMKLETRDRAHEY